MKQSPRETTGSFGGGVGVRLSCGPWLSLLAILLLLPLIGGCTALSPDLEAQSSSEESPDLPEQAEIDAILQLGEPPAGVAFDIRDYDEEALYWVMPRLENYIGQLRGRFPAINLALVSHGEEMLALMNAQETNYPELHQRIERLVSEENLNVHVCGMFAALNNLQPEDFPDFVDVSPSGPSQLADYRAVGYRIVAVELTW